MVNQNLQPLVLTATVYVQANSISDLVQIDSGIGPRDQLNIFAIYCQIQDGDFNLRDIDNDETDEWTHTDIQDIYLPSRDDEFSALPLCCNPRTWMGLYLRIFRNQEQMFRQNEVALSVLNNDASDIKSITGCEECPGHTGKILALTEPLAYYPSEEFNISVRNDNPIAEEDLTDNTYSCVKISFLCETVRKDATLDIMSGKDV